MVFSSERRRIAHYGGILCAAKKIKDDHPVSWTVPSDFKYVVLSYRKAAVLKTHTWAYLKNCGIPDARIMVVVQNPDCYQAYKAAGIPEGSLVEISTSGYVDAFNRVFAPQGDANLPLVGMNEVCVNMDDDICGLVAVGRQVTSSGQPYPMQVINLDGIMTEQMDRMEAAGCNLAGFDPCPNVGWLYKNMLFARGLDHFGLRFVIGQVRVIRNQGLRLQLQTGKSDYELTFRYFKADGGVVRSPLQIKAKKFTGGCASQGQMAEAELIKRHFPDEIPGQIQEHSDGTTSLRLAGMTFGEGRMLAKIKQAMFRRLGDSLSNRVVVEVEKEIKAEKQFERLKAEACKSLPKAEQLSWLRDEFVTFMTSRHGDDFDSASSMVPFPSSFNGWLPFPSSSAEAAAKEADEEDARPLKRQRAVLTGIESCRAAEAGLRTSASILECARRAADDGVAAGPPGDAAPKRKNTCKLCGESGHYAKTCPRQDPPEFSGMSAHERVRARRKLKGSHS